MGGIARQHLWRFLQAAQSTLGVLGEVRAAPLQRLNLAHGVGVGGLLGHAWPVAGVLLERHDARQVRKKIRRLSVQLISLQRLSLAETDVRLGEGWLTVRDAVQVDLVGILLERVLKVFHRLLAIRGIGFSVGGINKGVTADARKSHQVTSPAHERRRLLVSFALSKERGGITEQRHVLVLGLEELGAVQPRS